LGQHERRSAAAGEAALAPLADVPQAQRPRSFAPRLVHGARWSDTTSRPARYPERSPPPTPAAGLGLDHGGTARRDHHPDHL